MAPEQERLDRRVRRISPRKPDGQGWRGEGYALLKEEKSLPGGLQGEFGNQLVLIDRLLSWL